MEELLKSLRDVLRNRLSSPLAVCFLASWCVINFRVFLILFGEAPLAEKLTAFSDFVSQPNSAYHFLWCPLIAATIFLILYPFPALGVFAWWTWQQNLLKHARKRLEDRAPLTREDERKIRSQISQLESSIEAAESSYQTKIAQRDAHISTLEKQIEALEAKGASSSIPEALAAASEKAERMFEDADATFPDKRTPGLAELLGKIVSSGGDRVPTKSVLSSSGTSAIYDQSLLDQLKSHGYIQEKVNVRTGEMSLSLSPEGRKLVIEFGLVGKPVSKIES